MAKTPTPSSDQPIPGVPAPADVVDTLKGLEDRLAQLLPLVNTAQLAFGGQEKLQAQIKDLQNKIAQAKAVYQSA